MGTHNRFRVEERSGIIAVLDTKHADYKDTPGMSGGYNFVIAHWTGFQVFFNKSL